MILSPPGSGKTTQGPQLGEEFNMYLIFAGKFLREEVDNSEPEYAELILDHMSSMPPVPVPAKLMIELLRGKVEESGGGQSIRETRLYYRGIPKKQGPSSRI